jgi:hypothetical protein
MNIMSGIDRYLSIFIIHIESFGRVVWTLASYVGGPGDRLSGLSFLLL